MIQDDALNIVRWRNLERISSFSKIQSTITEKSHIKWFNETRKSRIDYIILIKKDNLPIGSISFKEDFSSNNSWATLLNNASATHLLGLKVKGLSMIDEGIFDGDIAIIKKTSSAQNGKIAAVLTLDNEITLKKIKITSQKIYLIPANKAYNIKEHNLGDVQIQGTLSGIIRKYN